MAELAGPYAWSQWEKDGNLYVDKMFSWLWEGIIINGQHESGVEKEIDQECAIFLHHQQERNGEANQGWS